MAGRDMSTQSSHSGRMVKVESDDDTQERLDNFWQSLPGGKALRERGITRHHDRQSNKYFSKAMRELLETTLFVESFDEELQKVKDEYNRRRKSLFNGQRFLTSEKDHPMNLDVDEYLEFMPKAWASERMELKKDIEKKFKRNAKPIPKFRPTASTPVQNSLELKLKQGRAAHNEICDEALQKTISVDRKKKIKANLSDMDLKNRPMHHLKTPLIDKPLCELLDKAESVETMYRNCMKKVSEDNLKSLLNPHTDVEEILQDYFKTHQFTATPKDKDLKTKAPLPIRPRPRLPDDQSSVTSGSDASIFAEYGVGPAARSEYGRHILRELLTMQNDQWNLQNSDSQSDKPPSSTGSSVRQKKESVLPHPEG